MSEKTIEEIYEHISEIYPGGSKERKLEITQIIVYEITKDAMKLFKEVKKGVNYA